MKLIHLFPIIIEKYSKKLKEYVNEITDNYERIIIIERFLL